MSRITEGAQAEEAEEAEEERRAEVDAAFRQVMQAAKQLKDPKTVENFLDKFSEEERIDILFRNVPEEMLVAAMDGLVAGRTPDPGFVEYVRWQYERGQTDEASS